MGHNGEMAFFRHEQVPFYGGIGVEGQEKGIKMLFLSIHHIPPPKNRNQVITYRTVIRKDSSIHRYQENNHGSEQQRHRERENRRGEQ